MDPKAFEDMKDLVIDNIDIIRTKIDICTNSGLVDEKSQMHNLAYELREDIDEIESYAELEEIVNKCKTMEITLDRYLGAKGQSTIALEWPNIEEAE